MGAQTFGVKASGINKFTAYVAIVFLLSAVLITCMRGKQTRFPTSEPTRPASSEQEQPGPPGVNQPPDDQSGSGSSEGG